MEKWTSIKEYNYWLNENILKQEKTLISYQNFKVHATPNLMRSKPHRAQNRKVNFHKYHCY